MNKLREYLGPEEYDSLLIEPLTEYLESHPNLTDSTLIDWDYLVHKLAAELSPGLIEQLREHYLQGMYHPHESSYYSNADETPLDSFLR